MPSTASCCSRCRWKQGHGILVHPPGGGGELSVAGEASVAGEVPVPGGDPVAGEPVAGPEAGGGAIAGAAAGRCGGMNCMSSICQRPTGWEMVKLISAYSAG